MLVVCELEAELKAAGFSFDLIEGGFVVDSQETLALGVGFGLWVFFDFQDNLFHGRFFLDGEFFLFFNGVFWLLFLFTEGSVVAGLVEGVFQAVTLRVHNLRWSVLNLLLQLLDIIFQLNYGFS